MPLRTFKDRVIAYKKDSKFLAVSLEFDLLSEGKTILDSLEKLHNATVGYLDMCCKDNESDKEIYRKAPKKYQDMYDLFVDLSEKKRKKETEKREEAKLRAKEVHTAQFTYPSTVIYA